MRETAFPPKGVSFVTEGRLRSAPALSKRAP
jgi:hypothetical protein